MRHHRKILVVDDSGTVRAQLRTFLEENGYCVVEAENGAVAVDLARSERPDLLVVDVNMPVLDGIGAVRRIRQLEGHAVTPIFMLTTETSATVAAQSKSAGATAWMVKPCRLDVLLHGVNAILKKVA